MSNDLDRMFGALRHDADMIPLDRATAARRRGDRRRRTRLIATATAVACALGAGMTGGALLTRGEAGPAPGERDWVVRQDPSPVGEEIPATSAAFDSATSAILDDRVLLGWRDDRRVFVRLADLETGQPIGEPRQLGWQSKPSDSLSVIALPWAFVAISRVVGVPRAYVIDPETGEVRFSVKFDIGPSAPVYHPDALVAVGDDRTVRAFDWRTGAVLWQEPIQGQHIPTVVGMGAAGAPVTDDRILHFVSRDAFIVRDIRTGRELSRQSLPTTVSILSRSLILDGRLYLTTFDGIWVFDVDGGGAPRRLDDRTTRMFTREAVLCRPARICVVDDGETADDLVAIDLGSGLEAWRVTFPGAVTDLTVAGSRVLLTTRDGTASYDTGERTSGLYDEYGRQLLSPEDQNGRLIWLTDGSLLTMGEAELVEVSAADGSRRVVGTAPNGVWDCSSWTTRRLVCHTTTGFRVWSIAD